MTKWRLLNSDTVLATPWLSVYKNKYELAEKKVIDDYYVVKRSNFVLTIAVKDEKLVFVKQYRPATDQFYIALPAGYLAHNELPEIAAKRELLEETGYTTGSCRLIGELHPLPGYIQSTAYVVLCEKISKSDSATIDSLEISEVIEVSWAEAVEMIIQGKINEMQAVAAILLARESILKRDPQNEV